MSVTALGAPVRGGWFGPEAEEFSPCIAEGEKDEWAKGLEFGPVAQFCFIFFLFYFRSFSIYSNSNIRILNLDLQIVH
jgi:hypothetical protein